MLYASSYGHFTARKEFRSQCHIFRFGNIAYCYEIDIFLTKTLLIVARSAYSLTKTLPIVATLTPEVADMTPNMARMTPKMARMMAPETALI